jgi:hypothetical protein
MRLSSALARSMSRVVLDQNRERAADGGRVFGYAEQD